jgi:MYXO-CTERM domain-containing protein
MHRSAFVLAVTCVALLGAREARAAATLMNGLGGPVGYGTSCMPPNDDGSWPTGATGLDLTPAFPKGLHFYSGSYTRGWINNNGSLSFKSAISTYTPNAFPGAPQPMIAPYWADVDTRDATECDDGNYPSGGSYPATATCGSGPDYTTEPLTNGVWWSLTPGQMVVTWNQVGYFLCHPTPANSFQMILTATGCGQTIAPDGGVAGVDFDIEFRYSQCGWEAGDASGGMNGFCPSGTVGTSCTPAQGGFDSAETPDTDFWSLPDSRMAGISAELCNNSNLTPAQPGVWKFSIRGGVIECPTAGQPCMTGQPGICAEGALQCTPSGTTTCVALTMPQPTQCNGLDNNCDGVIDTGPCPTNYSCVGAQCVPNCTEGTCPTGTTCQTSGVCIQTDCIGVTCPAGERCSNGQCVDACSGVTCPLGEVCRLGTCVNPCLGLNCGEGQVCADGTCVPTCQCMPCASGQTCEMSGLCVPTACATVTCPTGQSCEADAGTCIDDCTGAVCPVNQICQAGMCIPHITPYDAGMGLTAPDGGSSPPPADAGTEDATTSDASAMDGGGTPFGAGKQSPGCGCRTAGSGQWSAGAIGAMLGMIAIVLRRRRRPCDSALSAPRPR